MIRPPEKGPSSSATVLTSVHPSRRPAKRTVPRVSFAPPAVIGAMSANPLIGAPLRGWLSVIRARGSPPPWVAMLPSIRIRPDGQ